MQTKMAIKSLIGKNLRRLRDARHLTQDQLGALLDPAVDGSHIAGIEAGNGVSDEVLARICNALKIEPWEFYITPKTPLIRDGLEMEQIQLFRQAIELGIEEDMRAHQILWIKRANTKNKFEKASKQEQDAMIAAEARKAYDFIPKKAKKKVG